jgi:signal transduction histidine kinase
MLATRCRAGRNPRLDELVDITVSHLRRVPDARAGRFVCLQVRDTGEGMNPEVRARSSILFYHETGQGTGMGLATVHGIVQQHDG